MEFVLAGAVSVAELILVTVVYMSVAWPEKVPEHIARIPLRWRVFTLFLASVVAGAVIQWARLQGGVR
jgi:hypothetical protein